MIKRLSFTQYEELRKLWLQGASKQELADYFEIHPRSISRWMSEAGLGRSGHRPKKLDPNRKTESGENKNAEGCV